METDSVCPNCGYQVKQEDYYCPSCRHRIEFISSGNREVVDLEPIAEMVQLSKALIVSSLLYMIAIALTTAQSVILSFVPNASAATQSIIVMASISMSSASASYLAALVFGPSRRLRKLHYPVLLTFLLGIGNFLLVIGLASIYPFPSTLDTIVAGLGNSANVLQLASQYSTFFVLVGTAGFLGIFGTIGLVLTLLRSSRILAQPLIYYGMLAGVVGTFAELISGLPVFLFLAPLLIILGARKSLNSEFPQI